MPPTYARKPRSRPRIDRVTLITLVAFVIAACGTAILAVVWIRSAFPSAQQNPGTSASPFGGKTAKTNTGPVRVPAGPLMRANDPTPVAWDGSSRITLLFMGLDYRDWEEGDIPRTDSMILFSIDPSSKNAGMISIPRDLWVDIPGSGYNKINTAYRLGEMNNLPGGGPGLAMKTVEEVMGIPVHYYALVDFNAFVRFIDEMGGLDMKIREEIVIDPIGPGNTRKLEVGTQTLTGAEVLAYARNRYEGNDDFDRSRRQQEVIMAIRKQVVQFDMLPTLVSRAPQLYYELASGININLSLDQLIRLAMLAAQIDEQNIQKGVIGTPLQVEATTNTEDGQSILIPNLKEIRILRDQVFTGQGTAGAETVGAGEVSVATEMVATIDPAAAMQGEQATVLIQNGTTTGGLAAKAGELLKGVGVQVIGEENASQHYSTTTIYEYTGKQATVDFCIQALNLKGSRLFHRSDANPPADIVIILGSDWVSAQP